jgi:hypothetical protein
MQNFEYLAIGSLIVNIPKLEQTELLIDELSYLNLYKFVAVQTVPLHREWAIRSYILLNITEEHVCMDLHLGLQSLDYNLFY